MGYGNYRDPFVGRRPDYTVGAGEKLELTFVVLPGESRDIDVAIDLVGEGAEVSLKGLYLCGGDERVNFHILMHHRRGRHVPGDLRRPHHRGPGRPADGSLSGEPQHRPLGRGPCGDDPAVGNLCRRREVLAWRHHRPPGRGCVVLYAYPRRSGSGSEGPADDFLPRGRHARGVFGA